MVCPSSKSGLTCGRRFSCGDAALPAENSGESLARGSPREQSEGVASVLLIVSLAPGSPVASTPWRLVAGIRLLDAGIAARLPSRADLAARRSSRVLAARRRERRPAGGRECRGERGNEAQPLPNPSESGHVAVPSARDAPDGTLLNRMAIQGVR